MFLSKARAYPSGAPSKGTLLTLLINNYIMLKRLSRHKHSSLSVAKERVYEIGLGDKNFGSLFAEAYRKSVFGGKSYKDFTTVTYSRRLLRFIGY
jgi:hypothetical protein